jgi:hypothetical protein
VNDQIPARGGRVARIFKDPCGHRPALDLWFVVGIDDDVGAVEALTNTDGADARIEIVGVLTPNVTARWNLRHGEIRPPVSATLEDPPQNRLHTGFASASRWRSRLTRVRAFGGRV